MKTAYAIYPRLLIITCNMKAMAEIDSPCMHPTDSADQQACDWFGVMSSSSEYSIAGPCDIEVQRTMTSGPIRAGRVFYPVAWAASEGPYRKKW